MRERVRTSSLYWLTLNIEIFPPKLFISQSEFIMGTCKECHVMMAEAPLEASPGEYEVAHKWGDGGLRVNDICEVSYITVLRYSLKIKK